MYGNVISVWGVTDTLFQSSQIFMIAQKLRAEISRIGDRKVGLLGYTKYKLRKSPATPILSLLSITLSITGKEMYTSTKVLSP